MRPFEIVFHSSPTVFRLLTNSPIARLEWRRCFENTKILDNLASEWHWAAQCNVTHVPQLVATETGEARSYALSMYTWTRLNISYSPSSVPSIALPSFHTHYLSIILFANRGFSSTKSASLSSSTLIYGSREFSPSIYEKEMRVCMRKYLFERSKISAWNIQISGLFS